MSVSVHARLLPAYYNCNIVNPCKLLSVHPRLHPHRFLPTAWELGEHSGLQAPPGFPKLHLHQALPRLQGGAPAGQGQHSMQGLGFAPPRPMLQSADLLAGPMQEEEPLLLCHGQYRQGCQT